MNFRSPTFQNAAVGFPTTAGAVVTAYNACTCSPCNGALQLDAFVSVFDPTLDLDAIILKALERRPAQRYATAQDLRSDLSRYLDGVPVSARRQTAGYRAARFVRRHLLAVSVAAALLLAATAGAVIYGRRRAALRKRATWRLGATSFSRVC
jgi:hypothetical protein